MTTPTAVTVSSADTEDSQGATLQYCSTGEGTVDTYLTGVTTIPQINSGQQFEDDTDVGCTQRSYFKKTLPEDPDFELALTDRPGDSNQRDFTDMVEANTPISIKVTRATGRVQDFLFLPHDHYSGESGSEAGKQMYACIGKMQDITFTVLAAPST